MGLKRSGAHSVSLLHLAIPPPTTLPRLGLRSLNFRNRTRNRLQLDTTQTLSHFGDGSGYRQVEGYSEAILQCRMHYRVEDDHVAVRCRARDQDQVSPDSISRNNSLSRLTRSTPINQFSSCLSVDGPPWGDISVNSTSAVHAGTTIPKIRPCRSWSTISGRTTRSVKIRLQR